MKGIAAGLGIIAGLVGLLFATGALLPRTHTAASRIVVPTSIEIAWDVVRNIDGLAEWWPDMEAVSRLTDSAGRERWRQTMSGDVMTIRLSESQPPSRLVTDIVAEPGAPFGGRWVYSLRATDAGTEVTVTEEGWVSVPPFRLIAWLMGHHRTLDSYLRALGTRFGSTDPPIHVEP
jgi:uncharacterized protein YndB with AHSA1/START domain